jgi:hypothetical protein
MASLVRAGSSAGPALSGAARQSPLRLSVVFRDMRQPESAGGCAAAVAAYGECVRARLDDGERNCGPQWAELHACSERILAARRAARRG